MKAKRLFFFLLTINFSLMFLHSQESSEAKDEKTKTERIITIPAKKSPKPADKEKAQKAALKDEGKNSFENKIETIKYGIESEILNLIKDLILNDDPRFSNELYDLFYSTKSVAVREKLFEYFTKFSDPCIEDYADRKSVV